MREPTREEALADRLKNLRSQVSASPSRDGRLSRGTVEQGSSSRDAPESSGQNDGEFNEKRKVEPEEKRGEVELNEKGYAKEVSEKHGVEDTLHDEIFQTQDDELEELLRDAPRENDATTTELTEAQVKALLEELSNSVPQVEDDERTRRARSGKSGDFEDSGDRANDSDDSDGEGMKGDVEDVIARYRDEMELERELTDTKDEDEDSAREEDTNAEATATSSLDLPTVPSTTTHPSSSSPHRQPTSLDDLTTRLSALRTPSSSPKSQDPLSLPSVPSSKPTTAKLPSGAKRLTSRTAYTDDDVDAWCTVCLEDASLTCLGCEGDPYCVRCWREMHVGPRVGFEERSHRAVEFGKSGREEKGKRKVAMGA